ncbi:MAG: hypothetical protein IJU48_06250 [Synergistaceae bacterium]|nr:hypothetical protein [Synergistaceae bacterium]
MTRKLFTLIFLLVIVALSCFGLWPRFLVESANNNVSIVVDYREIVTLAKNSGLTVDEAIEILKNNGLTCLMVSELIGDNADKGIGHAELRKASDPERGTEGTIISIIPNSPHRDLLNEWLRVRFAVSSDMKIGPLFLPMPSNMLRSSGVIPDIDGLDAAKKAGLKIYYRPAPSPGHLSDRAAVMLRRVHEMYNVDVFTPSGEYVSGYPDVSALANAAKDCNIPVAKVEFSRQLGEPQLNAQVLPRIIPLHSVTNEEMTSRRITRAALRDRLIRAAVERSIRLLLLRTAPANTSSFKFSDFAEEVRLLGEGLKSHGFNLAWPGNVYASQNLRANLFAALAMSGILIFSVYRYLVRMGMNDSMKNAITFAIVGVILAVAMLKVSLIARLAGALTAPMIAVEASLLAMDEGRSRKIIPAFIFAVVGGLALASFFSTAAYMLRLNTFSGVKLTLVLPPLLVLVHDLKNRIHPESVMQFFSRPPLWGEIFVVGALLAGVGFIVFRSDNVANISNLENSMRESLERLLIARPRSREVFIGYPSILLLGFLVRNKLFANYREIFRIGVALGFSSVINSFCHFHTPLTLILLREFNGLWTGLIVGLVVVGLIKFMLIPILKLLRPIIS